MVTLERCQARKLSLGKRGPAKRYGEVTLSGWVFPPPYDQEAVEAEARITLPKEVWQKIGHAWRYVSTIEWIRQQAPALNNDKNDERNFHALERRRISELEKKRDFFENTGAPDRAAEIAEQILALEATPTPTASGWRSETELIALAVDAIHVAVRKHIVSSIAKTVGGNGLNDFQRLIVALRLYPGEKPTGPHSSVDSRFEAAVAEWINRQIRRARKIKKSIEQ